MAAATSFGWVPGALDIEFTQGEDFVMAIVINTPNPSPPPAQLPMNQTGAAYKFQIRTKAGSTVLVDATIAPCSVVANVVDPAEPDGLVIVTIPRAITKTVAAGDSYVYDFWILDGANVNHPYMAGGCTVNAAISVPEY